jgi:tRNA (guanine-N7-)-methyltransferase
METQKELKIPFVWEDRRPALLEKCLYLPSHYHGDEHLGKGIWKEAFEKEQPLAVEFCSGNGQWIANVAKSAPHLNWIAVEKDFYRASKIWLRLMRESISNLFVVCGESLAFSRLYLPDHCIEDAWVNFPDPWPKRKHIKNRLIQKPFAEELGRILKQECSITLVTDDERYSDQMIDVFAPWKSAFAPSRFVTELSGYGTSYFHSLWCQKQRTIHYHRFCQ